MREIKFRGLDPISNEWVYGDLIHGVGVKDGRLYILPNKKNLAYVKNCDPLDGVNVVPESVGQLTGLHDCKGVEIYEGDILNLSEGRVSKVVFEDGCFYTPVGTSRYRLGGWSSSFVEVIGNIYSNPELIK